MHFNIDMVPEDQRCIQSDTGQFQNYPMGECFFGARADALYGLIPFKAVPPKTTGFRFLLGGSQHFLLNSFLDSEFPKQTERLSVGSSSDDLGSSLDYSSLTESLAQVDFPNLEVLELGVWHLFCNAHCAFGQIGEIESLNSAMRNLKRLFLYGNCSLQSPLNLPYLEELQLVSDDEVTCINGGAVDADTVSMLLSSNLPNLKKVFLDLDVYNESVCYTIPESVMMSDAFPRLTYIELCGDFREGDRDRLRNSPSLNRPDQRVHLDTMRDFTAACVDK